MNENATTGLQNSGTSTQLRQVLSHLQIVSPADGDPMCQACGETIVEGDPVTLYLSQLAGQSRYIIDQCRCSDHNGDLSSLFTLDVREPIVDGRVGHCRDHATQQTWPVLLGPSIRLISPVDTKSVRRLTGSSQASSKIDDQRSGATNGTDLSAQCTTPTVQATGGRQ